LNYRPAEFLEIIQNISRLPGVRGKSGDISPSVFRELSEAISRYSDYGMPASSLIDSRLATSTHEGTSLMIALIHRGLDVRLFTDPKTSRPSPQDIDSISACMSMHQGGVDDDLFKSFNAEYRLFPATTSHECMEI